MSQSVDFLKSKFDLVANRIIGVNYQMFTWLFYLKENYLKEKSDQLVTTKKRTLILYFSFSYSLKERLIV